MPTSNEVRSHAERIEALGASELERAALLPRLDDIALLLERELQEAVPEHAAELMRAACAASDLYSRHGDWEKAVAILDHAGGLRAQGCLVPEMAEARKRQGRLYRLRARWKESLAAYASAHGIYARLCDSQGMADIDNSMGIVHFEKGTWDRSEEHYLRALDLTDEGSAALRAKIHNNLGALHNARGEIDDAIGSYLRCIPDFQTSDNPLGLAQAYHNLGMSFADKGDTQSAGEYYDKSLEISRRLGCDELTALTTLNHAELFVTLRSPAQAEEYCKTAIAMLTALDDRLGLAEAFKVLGVVASQDRDWEEAERNFERSLAINDECSSPLGLAEATFEYGRMCLDAGRMEEAHTLLGRSLALFENLKASKDIESVRMEVVKLDRLYLDIIEALGTAVERKDSYTMGHSSRVAYHALRIAETLGKESDEVRGIVIAAYLHDIGKIYVGDEVLNKPGKLTEAEFAAIKRHPERGVASLSAVEFPWQVKQYILHHHERWDGSGYPGGLRGEEIPDGAHIIAIADFFDALTSDRSYREAMSQEKAITIIRNNSGSLFDPKLVHCFLGLVTEGIIVADSSRHFAVAELWRRCTRSAQDPDSVTKR